MTVYVVCQQGVYDLHVEAKRYWGSNRPAFEVRHADVSTKAAVYARLYVSCSGQNESVRILGH